MDTALALERAGPWGQGFPEPLFDGRFEVTQAKIVGDRHVRYRLRGPGGRPVEGIHFGGAEQVGRGAVQLAYRLGVNRYQGYESPELRVEWLSPA